MKQKFGSRIINKNRLLSQEVCHVANQNYFYKPNINDLFTNILITNLIFLPKNLFYAFLLYLIDIAVFTFS